MQPAAPWCSAHGSRQAPRCAPGPAAAAARRLWGGVHFNRSNVEGLALGLAVGSAVIEALSPITTG